MKKHRISTNIGEDQKIIVELKQDYDFLEILSLKFTQKDIYTSLCSDYGVVCGRISANNGFGLPNAKVSIFIPLDEQDENDPVITELYPFRSPTDRNEDNIRYNLLPADQQHGGHTPTGTFPNQQTILSRQEVLEVYEKYYKYTVKTNESGDFMIWGVPVGTQTLHVDLDLSDIGCFSLRPYDFIKNGAGPDQFQDNTSFKSSEDLDSLPQIYSFDKTIDVYPFWGNEDLCEIGITRSDFDLSSTGLTIQPYAYLIGGTYTDSDKNSINKNCVPRREMGNKCELITKSGTIETIRFTNRKDELGRPILETLTLSESFDNDGSFVFPIPMNMDYVITNEFGENEFTNDPRIGIPTSTCARLRFSLSGENNSRVRQTASYVVPNIREFVGEEDESYAFSTNYDDYPTDAQPLILSGENGFYYPQDYFYRLEYNRVYTPSSFQSIYFKGNSLNNDRFVGLKDLAPGQDDDCTSDVATPPVNFGRRKRNRLGILTEFLLVINNLFTTIFARFTNSFALALHGIANILDKPIIRILARPFRNLAYTIQEVGQMKLSLVTYPNCEECTDSENDNNFEDDDLETCSVGTFDVETYGELNSYEESFVSLDEWVVNHNLGELTPLLQVFDENLTPVVPTNIVYNNTSTLTVFFSSEQSGSVRVSKTDSSVNVVKVENILFVQDTEGECVNSTPIISINDLVNRQEEYLISFNGLIDLDVDNGSYFFIDGGELFFQDRDFIFTSNTPTIVNVEIVQKDLFKTSPDGGSSEDNIAEGCDRYDKPYNEDLVKFYYVIRGGVEMEVETLQDSDIILGTNISDNRGRPLRSQNNPISQSGESEFRNGVFYFIPGTQSNAQVGRILREYRRRKRIGLLFCAGIINFSFIDNWLSGSLYFPLFKTKKRKACDVIVKYVEDQDRFYYRSTRFDNTFVGRLLGGNYRYLGRPTTIVNLGSRDSFINEICIDPDNTCSIVRNIGSSSFQNFEEILEFTINSRLDIFGGNYDVSNFFNNGGFSNNNINNVLGGDILQVISINNEIGIEEFDLDNTKYAPYQFNNLDFDTPNGQIVFRDSLNNLVLTPITMTLDDDGSNVRLCSNNLIYSQVVPFFLWDKKGVGFGNSDNQSWDYSEIQMQPLQNMTINYSFNDNDIDKFLLLPITYTNNGLGAVSGVNESDLFYNEISTIDDPTPFNNQYPGFIFFYLETGTIDEPISGKLYIRYGSAGNFDVIDWNQNVKFVLPRTENYYNGNKQILSTPFQFYFGLRPGKTGFDKFTELFGS